MQTKLSFISLLCNQYGGVPLLVAGDLFDHWKPSPWLLSMTIRLLPDKTFAIAGQHDLPQHNEQRLPETGLQTLEAAGKVTIVPTAFKPVLGPSTAVYGVNYGSTSPRKDPWPEFHGKKVLMLHQMVWSRKPPFPGVAAEGEASRVLSRHKWADLIVTGDNHRPFVSFMLQAGGGQRLLVNPGSMLRVAADQKKHRPRVYLWNAEENKVEPVLLPINKPIHCEYIQEESERDERMTAFVERVDREFEVGLSFQRNLEAWLAKNRVRAGVKRVLVEATEE